MAEFLDMDEGREPEDETIGHFIRGMKTLWVLTKSQHARILQAVGLMVFVEFLGLGITLIFSQLLNQVGLITEQGMTNLIVILLAAMLVSRVVAELVRRLIKEPIFLRALIRLENTWPLMAQEKLMALSLRFHERENTGRKIAKVNKGVDKLVNMMCDLYWGLLPILIYLITNFIILFFLDWRLAAMFLAPIIIAGWIQLRMYKKLRPHWVEWESKKECSVGLLSQSILNVRTVQSFVQEKREYARNGEVRNEMHDLDISISLTIQRYHLAINLVLGVSFILTIAAGLYFVSWGMTEVGTVVFLFVTGNVVLQNLMGMLQTYTRISRDLVAAERMHMLLNEVVDVDNTHEGIIPEGEGNHLSLEDITLTYPGKDSPALCEINLEIPAGHMYAFVGTSGAGKTTLAGLIARIYDPSTGRVCLNGTNIAEVDRDWYRRRFAFVSQDVEIFEGTIAENIAYVHGEVSDAKIAQAIEAACLKDMLNDAERFPKGIHTEVGERGVRLSGGERQRVGIARAYMALLNGAKTLVLDEATSSLDSQSESVIQAFLEQLRQTHEVTIIVVAHRLSTVQKADQICVLDNGVLVEQGTHEELLRENGIYTGFVELQDLGLRAA